MADIALAAVIRKAIDIAGALVVEEFSRLYWLQDDVLWIETEMKRIQAFMKDVDANEGESKRAKNLKNEIQILAYDVEDIIDKYFPALASHKSKGVLGCLRRASCCLCECYNGHSFVMEVKGIKKRVEDINRARNTFKITDTAGTSKNNIWDERRFFLHDDEPKIVGFDVHIKRLVGEVIDTDLQHRVISIVGMPGLGKTTLAKKVYDSVAAPITHPFECSAKVYVSQNPNIKELLQDIAKQVGLEEDKWKDKVEANLPAYLRCKRYVIFLDDIWNTQTWDVLKVGFPNSTGSRIILTSRYTNVGKYVGGTNFLHELLPLSPDDSWRLFSELVMDPLQITNGTSNFQDYDSLGRQIVENCGGVPLAIVVIAGLLLVKEKNEYEWKGVLKSMGQDEDKCSRVLALSYKDLPIVLKPCFLYFGLFPEDYEIYAFDLINMWVAEGFIQEKGELTVEDVGVRYLNHLTSRNLIQVGKRTFDGRIKSCRIHDLLHSLCIKLANESNFFNTHYDVSTGNSAARVRRVTFHRSSLLEYISSNYHIPKLRAILSFNDDDLSEIKRKCHQNFLGESKFLRVLRLECKGFPKSLPNEIGNLSHSSYLQLVYNSRHVWDTVKNIKPLPTWIRIGPVKLIPIMSNLKNLLTLDIRGFHIIVIPNVIWKMKQLRHILVSPISPFSRWEHEEHSMKRFHQIQVSLPNLQTLYTVNGCCLEANWLQKFPRLRKLGIYNTTTQIIEVLSGSTPVFDKLEKLRMEISFKKVYETPNLSRYVNLGRLHLEGPMRELPNHDKLPPNLTKLTLDSVELEKDPMETLRNLPKLKMLKLHFGSYKGEKMVCSEGPDDFPQLEVLQIYGLDHLLEITLDGGGMPNLKKVLIYYCSRLRRIPKKFETIIRESKGINFRIEMKIRKWRAGSAHFTPGINLDEKESAALS